MTTDQMYAALKSVGACFAVSTAKTILPNDPHDSKPSYHIHPDSGYPHQNDIERVYSQAQFRDWIATTKAAKRAVSQEQAFPLWQAYEARWE
jgi:hypothetical protein